MERHMEVARGLRPSGSPGRRAGRRMGSAGGSCGEAGGPRTPGEVVRTHGWGRGITQPAGTTPERAGGDRAITGWMVIGSSPRARPAGAGTGVLGAPTAPSVPPLEPGVPPSRERPECCPVSQPLSPGDPQALCEREGPRAEVQPPVEARRPQPLPSPPQWPGCWQAGDFQGSHSRATLAVGSSELQAFCFTE